MTSMFLKFENEKTKRNREKDDNYSMKMNLTFPNVLSVLLPEDWLKAFIEWWMKGFDFLHFVKFVYQI